MTEVTMLTAAAAGCSNSLQQQIGSRVVRLSVASITVTIVQNSQN